MSIDSPSDFIRNLIRQESLVRKFIPPLNVMEDCPEKEEYDKQRAALLKKQLEFEALYKRPFEEAFSEKYKNRIQEYVDYLIKLSDCDEATFEFSYWVITQHHLDRISLSCMCVDLDIPFEYLFRKMPAEEWFKNKQQNEKLL
jgi:hypothetical protein